MRSKEFITEGSQEEIIDAIAKEYNISSENMDLMVNVARQAGMKLNVIEWCIRIAQECQPFIREVGWDTAFKLFRGVNGEYNEFIKKRVRLENRTPRSMDPNLFEEINEYFLLNYGAPFRNSMLTTGDQHHTRLFGKTYMVFPIGNFKFLWNEKIDDFNFAHSDFKKSDIVQDNVEGSVWSSKNKDIIDDLFLNKFVKKIDWHNIDLKSAIKSDSEIMIRCKAYYGISFSDHKNDIKALKQIMELAV